MNTFYVLLKWLALAAITLASQNVAFTLYTIANPQTMGFMGDETPYNFERLIVAIFFLGFLAFNSIPIAAWQRNKQHRTVIKILITTFIVQTMVTSAVLLGPLYYYRWFVAN